MYSNPQYYYSRLVTVTRLWTVILEPWTSPDKSQCNLEPFPPVRLESFLSFGSLFFTRTWSLHVQIHSVGWSLVSDRDKGYGNGFCLLNLNSVSALSLLETLFRDQRRLWGVNSENGHRWLLLVQIQNKSKGNDNAKRMKAPARTNKKSNPGRAQIH